MINFNSRAVGQNAGSTPLQKLNPEPTPIKQEGKEVSAAWDYRKSDPKDWKEGDVIFDFQFGELRVYTLKDGNLIPVEKEKQGKVIQGAVEKGRGNIQYR